MKTISETEHARLAQRVACEPLERMGCLVSLPPANGLGLLVTLPVRERIADCAKRRLQHAAGNTRTNSSSTQHIKRERSVTGTGDAASWMARRRRRLALTANSNPHENLKPHR